MEHAHGEKIAQLSFGCFGVERSLTTRNRLTPFSRISMSLVDGPLDALEGAWTFSEHPDGTTIILELDYTLHEGFSIPGLSTLLSTLTHPFYDAFIQEAHRRYAHC